MSTYQQAIDKAIIDFVRRNPKISPRSDNELQCDVLVAAGRKSPKSSTWLTVKDEIEAVQIIDRRLPTLKKRGALAYSRAEGWTVTPKGNKF